MTELWFWGATALIVMLSVLLFVVPMLSGKTQDVVASRDQLNKAFFRDRMVEISAEGREGLIDDKSELEVELSNELRGSK